MALLDVILMDCKGTALKRKKIQRSFRIFEDQLESLRWLAEVKYRGRRNLSDLLRDFLDQGIDPEIESKKGY